MTFWSAARETTLSWRRRQRLAVRRRRRRPAQWRRRQRLSQRGAWARPGCSAAKGSTPSTMAMRRRRDREPARYDAEHRQCGRPCLYRASRNSSSPRMTTISSAQRCRSTVLGMGRQRQPERRRRPTTRSTAEPATTRSPAASGDDILRGGNLDPATARRARAATTSCLGGDGNDLISTAATG